MHGHYEDITNVDFTLTELSQMIGVGEDDELWLAHLPKPRRGEGCFDLCWLLIAGSQVSTKRECRNNTYPIR